MLTGDRGRSSRLGLGALLAGVLFAAAFVVLAAAVILVPPNGPADRSAGDLVPSSQGASMAASPGSPSGAPTQDQAQASASIPGASIPGTSIPGASISTAPGPGSSTATASFADIGLDGAASESPVARTITFEQQGPGSVSLSLAEVASGTVEVCLGQGPDGQQGSRCQMSGGGLMEATTDATGPTIWTATLIGTSSQVSPVDVTVAFPSAAPRLSIAGFRFQGTEFGAYNGVDVTLRTSVAGSSVVQASWDAVRPFSMTVVEEAGAQVDQITAEDQAVTRQVPVSPGSAYRFRLQNAVEVDDEALFLSATFTWP